MHKVRGSCASEVVFAEIYCHKHMQYGQTALHKAARHGHDKICSMLIDHKADMNVSETVCYALSIPFFFFLHCSVSLFWVTT